MLKALMKRKMLGTVMSLAVTILSNPKTRQMAMKAVKSVIGKVSGTARNARGRTA